jgi:hypothetical protein
MWDLLDFYPRPSSSPPLQPRATYNPHRLLVLQLETLSPRFLEGWLAPRVASSRLYFSLPPLLRFRSLRFLRFRALHQVDCFQRPLSLLSRLQYHQLTLRPLAHPASWDLSSFLAQLEEFRSLSCSQLLHRVL